MAVRLVVEDGLPYRTVPWQQGRDHRVFVPFTTLQKRVETAGKKGGAQIEAGYLDRPTTLRLWPRRLDQVDQINAVKTFLAFCINGVSVVVFVLGGKVHWSYALVMAVGAILGGYLKARIARRIKLRIVRWFISAVGLGLAAFFFYKQFVGTGSVASSNL